MKQDIDVSVIVPTYRRPGYLSEGLRKLLQVSTLSLEIIVIDDSPDAEGDEIVAALNDPRIKYYRREVPSNGRPALLRNDAARIALGTVFYFLDDDDEVIPDALPGAYELLRRAPQGVLLTLPQPFGADARRVANEIEYYEQARRVLAHKPSAYALDARLTFTSSFVVPSACLVKRRVFEKVGGFDGTFAFCEDVDFFAKAIAGDGCVLSDKAFVRRRVGHSSLMSEAKADALRHAYLQLRRGFRARHGALAYWSTRIRYRLSDR